MTKDEADALAGIVLLDPTRTDSSCVYPGPTTGPIRQVEVWLFNGIEPTSWLQDTPPPTAVAGLGDEAVCCPHGAIVFRKGTEWVVINLVRTDLADTRQQLIDAATRALTRF